MILSYFKGVFMKLFSMETRSTITAYDLVNVVTKAKIIPVPVKHTSTKILSRGNIYEPKYKKRRPIEF